MLNPQNLVASALILGSVLATGSLAWAQGQTSVSPTANTADDHGGMMRRGGGMMGSGMMNGADPAQMNRMVENCNRMMERMQQEPTAEGANSAQELA